MSRPIGQVLTLGQVGRSERSNDHDLEPPLDIEDRREQQVVLLVDVQVRVGFERLETGEQRHVRPQPSAGGV